MVGITKHMTSTHIVKRATEYLDQCAASNTEATLVGMHWHIDGRDKTLPSLDELNLALIQRPVFVQRENGRVVFASDGKERALTQEDMQLADKLYRKEFAVALRKSRRSG